MDDQDRDSNNAPPSGSGKKCCNRETCPVHLARMKSEQDQQQRSQQQQPPLQQQKPEPDTSATYFNGVAAIGYDDDAAPSKPPTPTEFAPPYPEHAADTENTSQYSLPKTTAEKPASTQILFVEPNFQETPSEYEAFYDCFSDSDEPREGSAVCLLRSKCTCSRVISRNIGLGQISSKSSAYPKDKKRVRHQHDISGRGVHLKSIDIEITGHVNHSLPAGFRITPVNFCIPLQIQFPSSSPSSPLQSATEFSLKSSKQPHSLPSTTTTNMFSCKSNECTCKSTDCPCGLPSTTTNYVSCRSARFCNKPSATTTDLLSCQSTGIPSKSERSCICPSATATNMFSLKSESPYDLPSNTTNFMSCTTQKTCTIASNTAFPSNTTNYISCKSDGSCPMPIPSTVTTTISEKIKCHSATEFFSVKSGSTVFSGLICDATCGVSTTATRRNLEPIRTSTILSRLNNPSYTTSDSGKGEDNINLECTDTHCTTSKDIFTSQNETYATDRDAFCCKYEPDAAETFPDDNQPGTSTHCRCDSNERVQDICTCSNILPDICNICSHNNANLAECPCCDNDGNPSTSEMSEDIPSIYTEPRLYTAPKTYKLVYPQHIDMSLCRPCRFNPSPLRTEKGKVFCPGKCGCCLCPWKPRVIPENTHVKVKECKCRERGSIFTDFDYTEDVSSCDSNTVFDLCPCCDKAQSKYLELYGHQMDNPTPTMRETLMAREVLLSEVHEIFPKYFYKRY